jgi:di/tricarboxylate transporter
VDIVLTIVILVLAVGMFVWNRLPVEIVALLVSLALLTTSLVGFEDIFEGFASPTIVLIAALFVIAEGIDAAGITTWLGGRLIRLAGQSRARLLIFIMSAVALLTAVISVTGAVAALLPMIVVMCVRLQRRPSKVLMPVAFAAHAGSLLVLTGSPVNVLIAQAAQSTGQGEFDFFEYALVGLPVFIGTVLVVLLLGERLLPERSGASPRDLSAHSRVLKEQYLDGQALARLKILPGSPLIGRTPWLGLTDHELFPEHRSAPVHVLSPQTSRGKPLTGRKLAPGDQLVVRGRDDDLSDFCDRLGAAIDSTDSDALLRNGLINKEYGVAEVLVPPRSALIGTDVYPGMVTDSGQLVVLAHQRVGERLPEKPAALAPGDSLLLQGRWAALDEHTAGDELVLVDSPDAIRRQTVPLGPRAKPALIILALMVVLLTADLIPASITCLVAAIAMVLTKVVTPSQAHRSMQWETLILVAAMIPMSTAITETAELLAHAMVDLVGGVSPHLYLLGLALVTAVLGQLISNTATSLILIPIGISVSAESGISALTVLMAINVASAAALFTPVATAANLMLMQPAGYRFGDYWKLGSVVMIVYLAVAVFLVPVFWPFVPGS